jgi:phosphoglycerate dehydrogenase-like enzyme
MRRVRAFVSVNLGPEGFARLTAADPGIEVIGAPHGIAIVDPAEIKARSADYPQERPDLDVAALLAEAEILVASRLPSDLPARAPRLRWIHTPSAGIDAIWHPYLDREAYVVTTGKGIHAIGISEFVLGAMLVFARDFPRLLSQSRTALWQKFTAAELHGRTVAIVGVGAIGSAVATRSSAFGMRVIGLRRQPEKPLPAGFEAMVPLSRITDLLGAADYVVNCLPLTAQTKGMLDASRLEAMRPGSVFINVGRGGTTDGEALRRLLAAGRIRGAVLDVQDREPLPPDDPLWRMQNVIVTPHLAGLTDGRDARGLDILCENFRRFASGEPLLNVFDGTAGY